MVIQGFGAKNDRPKTSATISGVNPIYGFHGSALRKKKTTPKKELKTEFYTMKKKKNNKIWETEKAKKDEKIGMMFRERLKIEDRINTQTKSEKEELITSMLRKYAHSYPENQVILNNIVEANIRRVELTDANTKAKEKINGVISSCITIFKLIDNDERKGFIRNMVGKDNKVPYKHPWLDNDINI